MHLGRDGHVWKHPQPIASAWGFKYKYKMQCRGGGRQPIRPPLRQAQGRQGFSPASPAPPPPSFPSPNRPGQKTKCGSVSPEIGVPRPRERCDMRLPIGRPKRVFWGSVEAKRKGSGEGAGGDFGELSRAARGKLLGPYIGSPSPRPHCICISSLNERRPANVFEKCGVVIREDCVSPISRRSNNPRHPQLHGSFQTPVKMSTHP
jgi:hypothetical protein